MNKTKAAAATVLIASAVSASVKWSDLTRRDTTTIEVNAGPDMIVQACEFPVYARLRGEVFFKDKQNWKK